MQYGQNSLLEAFIVHIYLLVEKKSIFLYNVLMINTEENWKTTDINPDSLWVIEKRDKTGKHENNYHGNFVPQIPNQLIRRFTNL